MSEFGPHHPWDRPHGRTLRRTGALFAALGVLCGCRVIDTTDQRLLSKPGMSFANPRAFEFGIGLTMQVEPGASAAGSREAHNCPTCK